MPLHRFKNLPEECQLSAMQIAVLVTVHNRADTTVQGLSRLSQLAEAMATEFQFVVFLVDDGSTDGTASRIRDIPLDLRITQGTGSLYWNRGMSLAYTAARDSGQHFDAYMLYNDDVLLNENFVEFLRVFRDLQDSILVGAFREPHSDTISYSGFVALGRLRPFALLIPQLTDSLVPVDTFNGNAVLIPAQIFDELGGLDPKYTHSYGDIDLGLRAKAAGVRSFIYGDPIGVCGRGKSVDERIRAAGIRDRWSLLFGYPHGPSSYLRFVRKHGVREFLPIYALHEVTRRGRKLFWRRTP